MSGSTPPASGATGISPALKYVLVAIVTVIGVALGYLQSQPTITEATVIAAVVYTLPTALSELEGA
jgi:hypothetical protein